MNIQLIHWILVGCGAGAAALGAAAAYAGIPPNIGAMMHVAAGVLVGISTMLGVVSPSAMAPKSIVITQDGSP